MKHRDRVRCNTVAIQRKYRRRQRRFKSAVYGSSRIAWRHSDGQELAPSPLPTGVPYVSAGGDAKYVV